MGISQKTLELKCPKCQDLIRVRIDRSMLEQAKRLPISVSYIHGDPMHATTVWVDNDFVIRAVEAPDNTILGHGIPAGAAQPTAVSSVDEIPSEAELTDQAISKIEKAIRSVSRISEVSGDIVLVLTSAQNELAGLSERHRRVAGTAKGVAEKKTPPEMRKIARRAARPSEPRIVKRDY
ncbi:MAG: hypothetical protein WED04_11500 [Promethearchaeati archaeon SRVP18_Atabeyarchaeia-1]